MAKTPNFMFSRSKQNNINSFDKVYEYPEDSSVCNVK